MKKFKDWLYQNRYAVLLGFGITNAILAILYLWMGEYALAAVWTVLAVSMLWDASEVK